MTEAHEKVLSARAALLRLNPFFGVLAMRLGDPIAGHPKVTTMATDGARLFYHPAAVLAWTFAQLIGVVAHETLHCALMHMARLAGKDMELANKAADYAINPLIIAAGMELPRGCLIDPRFYGLGFEEIYSILAKEAREAKDKAKAGQPQSGGQPGKSGQQGGQPQAGQPGAQGGQPPQGAGAGQPSPGNGQPGGQQGAPAPGAGQPGASGQPSGQGAPAASQGGQPGNQAGQPGGGSPGGQPGNGSAQGAGGQPGGAGGQRAPGASQGGGGGQGAPAPAPAGQGGQPGGGQPGNNPAPTAATPGNGQGNGAASAKAMSAAPCADNINGCGGILMPGDGTPAAAEDTAAKWQTWVRQAVAVARKAGHLPGGLADSILGELSAPKIDVADVFREYLDSKVATDQSFTRPNRRFIASGLIIPGTVIDGLDHVIFAIDDSGSIGGHELSQAGSEVVAALESEKIQRLTVLFADTRVHTVQELERGDDIDGRALRGKAGGGGTGFADTFRWIRENAPDATAIIYLTDMECSQWGEDPEIPVLWAVHGDSRQFDKLAARAPFGEAAYVGRLQ